MLTSYLVSNAIVLPISGWIASKIGRKRFYMTCVALFTLSSFLCGIAPSLGWLDLLPRPPGRRRRRPRAERAGHPGGHVPAGEARAWRSPSTAWRSCSRRRSGPRSAASSPTTTRWRWVFFINVPVGIASLLLSNRMVTDPPHLKQAARRARAASTASGSRSSRSGSARSRSSSTRGRRTTGSTRTSSSASRHRRRRVARRRSSSGSGTTTHPIVDVRMFQRPELRGRQRDDARCSGVSLFGSTVLLPQSCRS